MSFFLTIIGICSALLIFLHLIRLKENVSNLVSFKEPIEKLKTDKIQFKQLDTQRVCPICRTGLLSDEYLICAMAPETNNGKSRQVHIYGCHHCFTTGGVNLQMQKIKPPSVRKTID